MPATVTVTVSKERRERVNAGKTHNVIICYKGSEEVSSWLKDLAADVGLPVSNTLDMALKEYAEKRRFRRMPRRQGPTGRPRKVPA